MEKVHRFKAVLNKDDKITGAGIAIPFDVYEVFGIRGRIPVKGSINGYPYRSTLSSFAGVYYLHVKNEAKDGANVSFGDTVDVILEFDNERRDVEPSKDFARALAKNRLASARWKTMSFSHKTAVMEHIEDAKKPETRERRIRKMVALLENEEMAKQNDGVKLKPAQTLSQKLQIKEGRRVCVINPPDGYVESLGEMPPDSRISKKPTDPVDIIQLFVENRDELETHLPALKSFVAPKGMIWVTYYKGTAKIKTDINRDTIWQYARTLGMEGVAMISVNENWSAMRLKVVE